MELQYYLVGFREETEIEIRKDGDEIYRGTCEDAVLDINVLNAHHSGVKDIRFVMGIYILEI